MISTIRSYLQSDDIAEARPFYLIISFVLLGTAALTIIQSPQPPPLGRLLVFIVLLAVHLALHWLSGLFLDYANGSLLYPIIQGLLALSIALIMQKPEMVLALFSTLIAETIGVFGFTRSAISSVVGFILLTLFSYYQIGGGTLLRLWIEPAASTITLLIIFIVLYRRQLDAREQSQTLLVELEAANRQLASYATQVESLTLAGERQRMARELHDTLAQGVAGLVLQLEAVTAHLDKGRSERAQVIVEQSMKRARTTLADARAAIDDLRLEQRSLVETIEHQIGRFTRATGIPCHTTLDVSEKITVSDAVSEHVARIVGECLANITRHAQAHNVWLSVTNSAETLTIDIRDDGIGFDLQAVESNGHYGILGMRERVRLVDGTFEMTSELGNGTHLRATLPLERS